MKTNKGFRDENHADELRKAKRLEPIHKSGTERHTIYRELDDEEDDAPVMVWFDCETEMLVTKRTWKYDIEEEETVCILGVKFIHYEDL